jgi:hypothetical protein
MAKYLVEFIEQLRCPKVIEANSWDEAKVKAEAMKDDIPESEFKYTGYSEREFYVAERIMFSDEC